MAQGWVGGTCVNMPYDTATWLGKYYTFLILQYESMEVLGLANPANATRKTVEGHVRPQGTGMLCWLTRHVPGARLAMLPQH
eukprot:scaffold221442_cov22-Tisochrysis_lutea.AAC.3